MKVFISWSGEVSRPIAQEIRDWIPLILNVNPFITTSDVDKGARWQGEIARELDQSNFGIVCLTRDNLQSRWLAFEAGALSKHLVGGRVATVLFGLDIQDVPSPFNMFQATQFKQTDFRQLLGSINSAIPPEQRREDQQLDRLFLKLWPDLEEPIRLVLENAAQNLDQAAPPAPDFGEIAAEMMAMLRQQNAILASPEKLFQPIMDALDQRWLNIVSGRGALTTGWSRVSGQGHVNQGAADVFYPAEVGNVERSETPLPLRASPAEPCKCDDLKHLKHVGRSCGDPATREGLCNDCYEHRAAKQMDSTRGGKPYGGPPPRR